MPLTLIASIVALVAIGDTPVPCYFVEPLQLRSAVPHENTEAPLNTLLWVPVAAGPMTGVGTMGWLLPDGGTPPLDGGSEVGAGASPHLREPAVGVFLLDHSGNEIPIELVTAITAAVGLHTEARLEVYRPTQLLKLGEVYTLKRLDRIGSPPVVLTYFVATAQLLETPPSPPVAVARSARNCDDTPNIDVTSEEGLIMLVEDGAAATLPTEVLAVSYGSGDPIGRLSYDAVSPITVRPLAIDLAGNATLGPALKLEPEPLPGCGCSAASVFFAAAGLFTFVRFTRRRENRAARQRGAQ